MKKLHLIDDQEIKQLKLDLELWKRSFYYCSEEHIEMDAMVRQLEQEKRDNQKIIKEITELWFDMLEDGIGGLPSKESGAIFEKLSSILPKKIRDARLKEFVENKK